MDIFHNIQGVDGSAGKPALAQDTDYKDEKTYQLKPCLGPFGVY